MKIINQGILNELEKGAAIRLNLGCGQSPRKGFYSVDHIEMDGIDMVADLNQPLDLLPDDCCDYIYSRHAFEHIQEFLPLMREIFRISKPGGTVEVIVPHFSNVYGHSDPTHVRLFGLYSMYYFVARENQPKRRKVPAFYSDARFRVTSVSIEFYRSGIMDKLFAPILSRIVNCNLSTQDFYERRLAHWFHAWQIRYLLAPEK